MNRALIIFTLAFASNALAIPQQINYQGQLTRPDGTPLDTTVAISFRLYNVVAGGTALWTESHPAVSVNDGLFQVLLGSVTTLPDSFTATTRWLGVTVGGNTEMTPRRQIASVPYAFRVGTVDGASGGNISGKLNVGANSTNAGLFANSFGQNTHARGDYSFVAGGAVDAMDSCSATGQFSVVSGGRLNFAGNIQASVGGGYLNRATGSHSRIGGGTQNDATGTYAAVLGGEDNNSTTSYTTVGGGRNNNATNLFATVSGGDTNVASGRFAFVGGGNFNTATDSLTTVSGGRANAATGKYSTIGGGRNHSALGISSCITGGENNSAADTGAAVLSGRSNSVDGVTSVICGGGPYPGVHNVGNSITGDYSAIVGGVGNSIPAYESFIGGGERNTASGFCSAVAGGISNTAEAAYTVVAGGGNNHAVSVGSHVCGGTVNTAEGSYSGISGGTSNYVPGLKSSIVGGESNLVSGSFSVISGGYNNEVQDDYAVVGGGLNNVVSGNYSTVPGGQDNSVTGSNSFVCGEGATVSASNAFVWWDGTSGSSIGSSNTFSALATNGVRFWTNSGLTSGVTMAAGASAWVGVSDSTRKRDIRLTDTKSILEKMSELPIKNWEYKSEAEGIEHIGPMAQDFWNAFRLGSDSLGIATNDADGVLFAAVQELTKKNLKLEEDLRYLREMVQSLLAEKQQSLMTDKE